MDEMNAGAEPQVRPQLAGIGGWLVLPAIGLVVTPVLLAASLIIVGMSFSSLPSKYTGYLGLCMLLDAGLLAYALIAAIQFFKKKASAPGTVISFMIVNLAVAVGTAVIAKSLGLDEFLVEDMKAIAKSVVGCAIWIPYFKKSLRVKATFTH